MIDRAPDARRSGRDAADAPAVERDLLATIAAIRAGQHKLHAFSHIPDDGAILAAAGSAATLVPSGLKGMPIGVKDLIDTADMPTTYGSDIYRDHRPSSDAEIVRLLRQAGGVIMGKTATTPFATWVPTNVRNPCDRRRTPGGSSSGSAAAVAAGIVPVALGTQTLGSVIRPASYCGVVGFKPTFGALGMAGVKPLAPTFDTLGLLGQRLEDVGRVFRTIAAPEPARATDALRFGLMADYGWAKVKPDARRSMARLLKHLAENGFAIGAFGTAPAFDPPLISTIYGYELRRSLTWEFERHSDLLPVDLARAIADASAIPAAAYDAALRALEHKRGQFDDFLDDTDCLLCLAATGEAPLGLASTGDPVMNSIWTALGMPCLTLPVLSGRNGLPIGLQLIMRRGADDRLLAAGLALQKWLDRSSPIADAR